MLKACRIFYFLNGLEKQLGNYAKPITGLAFPNFIVEHKSEGSMRIAHTQCRLDGAFAARAYYELHGLYGSPEIALNTALVGTVEFNGEIFVGNVHWVSKPSNDGKELSYHMRRVACFFTRGLCVEDFLEARRIARNFREYFADLRVEHLRKLQDLPPRWQPPNYAHLQRAALTKELEKRGLSVKGVKGELVKRLENDDTTKNAEALEGLIEAAGQSLMNSQGSNAALSFEDPTTSDPPHSFRLQKHAREAHHPGAIQPQGQKRQRRESD
jgi:hypothetical protein